MPTNKIANAPSAATIHDGYHTGIGTDLNDGRLYINRGASQGREPISTNKIITLTTSSTLTPADDGAVVIADSTTSVVVQLPPTAAGLRFTLFVKQLTSSGGHAFSPNANDKIFGNGVTATDDHDFLCPAATDRVGDCATIVGDGIDGWYVQSVNGTWTEP